LRFESNEALTFARLLSEFPEKAADLVVKESLLSERRSSFSAQEAKFTEWQNRLQQIEGAEKWKQMVARVDASKRQKNHLELAPLDAFQLDDDLFFRQESDADLETRQRPEETDEIEAERNAFNEEKEQLEAERQILRELEEEIEPARQSVFDHKTAVIAAAKRMVLLYRRVVEDD
jgi:hypothetical protein